MILSPKIAWNDSVGEIRQPGVYPFSFSEIRICRLYKGTFRNRKSIKTITKIDGYKRFYVVAHRSGDTTFHVVMETENRWTRFNNMLPHDSYGDRRLFFCKNINWHDQGFESANKISAVCNLDLLFQFPVNPQLSPSSAPHVVLFPDVFSDQQDLEKFLMQITGAKKKSRDLCR